MRQQVLLQGRRVEVARDSEQIQAFFEAGVGLEFHGAQVVKLDEQLKSGLVHPVGQVKVLSAEFATELLAVVLFLLEHGVS